MIKPSISIIGTNGLPGRYGGWDQLLNHLTDHLRGIYSMSVYTSYFDAVDGLDKFNGAELPIIYLRANGAQSVLYDIFSMIHSVLKKHDILLILGTSGCIFVPLLKMLGIKTILNPDGAEWKRGKWSPCVKRFLAFSEEVGIKYSTAIIADNKIIQDYILNTYSVKAFLIEYGGDNAKAVEMRSETESLYNVKAFQYAFKVCRIVPENNIDLILDAFSRIEYNLILIGNWNFSDYGKKTREKFKAFDNLIMLDPIYDQHMLDELRSNCNLYVHGHSVGGTNPSLVEAMNLSLCCLVYDVDYNRETTENVAIYFNSVDSLLEKLNLILTGSIDSVKVGTDLREIAKRRYGWKLITSKYDSVFQSVLINNIL
jgi:glycosyltransferase involved in cell wall biosynthesis